MGTKKQARLEILSQNNKYIQTQVSRVKQAIGKGTNKDASLANKTRTSFREQSITVISILTAFSLTISTIVIVVTGVFGEGRGPVDLGLYIGKYEGNYEGKYEGNQPDTLKRLDPS